MRSSSQSANHGETRSACDWQLGLLGAEGLSVIGEEVLVIEEKVSLGGEDFGERGAADDVVVRLVPAPRPSHQPLACAPFA